MMTHCWFTLLMGIFHLHPYGTNRFNQVLWLRPLPHHQDKTNRLWLCVCVAKEISRGNVSPAHSLIELHLKKKRGIKPLNFKAVVLLLTAPHSSKAAQILLFLHHGCSCSACVPPPHPPKPFVLLTPLTWCSHHCPCRHSQQRAENRKTRRSYLKV